MSIITFPNQKEPPMHTPQGLTEELLQALLEGTHALDMHLALNPDSLNHVRWAANEGDPGCKGAAVVVALIEKNMSRIKARIMNNFNKGAN